MSIYFKNKHKLKLLTLWLILLCSCSTNPEITPPPGVKAINYISAYKEEGTRPYPDADGVGAILVEWHDVDIIKNGTLFKKDFGGFNVYRTTLLDSLGKPKGFEKIRTLYAASGEADTSIIDENVDIEQDFFYVIKGFSKSDNSIEGNPSDTVRFKLLRRPALQSPKGDVSSDSIIKFTFTNTTVSVAIQVYEVDPDERTTPLKTMWQENLRLPLNNNTHAISYNGASPLEKGKSYKWRVDRIAEGESSAGASKWGFFNYK